MKENLYKFEPVTKNDLPLLRRWLNNPFVREWWGEPDHEINLIVEDLASDLMTNYLVRFENQLFAYAQYYDIGTWPQDHFDHLPAGSKAIDTFIGEPDMLGAGHGSAYLRQLADQLIADGATTVVIDPVFANIRARRSFEKAGFAQTSQTDTIRRQPVVMVYSPN